jgi:predicted nucleotidyltransferase
MAIMQTFPQEQITDFCRRHHIRRLSVFGSRLQGNHRPDSDLDVLVEFEPGHTPGLDYFGMQDELSEILSVKVDLKTPGFLSPYFRDEVLQHADLIYAQS